MQSKTPKKETLKKTMNESMLDFSIPRDKLFPLHSHTRTPSLRLKESLAASNIFQDQPVISSRKDPLVSWGFPKTPQRAPIDLSDMQVSSLVSKIPSTTKHSRSNSTLQQANLTAKEGFFPTSKPKKQSKIEVQGTPTAKKPSQGKMAALKELYQVPLTPQRKTPQASIARNSMSLIPTEFMSPKNGKDQKESIDNLLSSLKGVVFSDTKNRLSKYQRRFLELNGGESVVGETISTPKPVSKREDGTPKAQAKNKQSQMLAQALSQCLSVKSPSRGPSRAGTPCQVSPRDEKEVLVFEKEKIFPQTVKHQHKRGLSWGQTPMFIEGPIIEKGSAKVTKEEEYAREERERMRAAEEELEQFNKFLCIDMQTFDFEKAIIMRREFQKSKKNSMAVISGVSNGDVDVRDRDTMLRSMFAYYSKESEKPASTGESSSKNQQGSTTCNSSKLASEVLEMKREKKKKGQEQDRDLEQFLEMLENNQKSTKRRSYKQEEF